MSNCPTCGNESRSKFCSPECVNIFYSNKNLTRGKKEIAHNKRLEYSKSPRRCRICNKILEYDSRTNKYCSVGCANKNRRKYSHQNCITCGRTILTGEDKCVACSRNEMEQQKIARFLSGEEDLPADQAKNILLGISDNKCEECGWGILNIFTKKIPLELHHNDGNKENNNRKNLKILCPNCHSLTKNFRFNLKGKQKSSTGRRNSEVAVVSS